VSARRLAVLVWAACVVMAVPTVVLLVLEPGGILPGLSSDIFSGLPGASGLLLALAFSSVGVIVARRVADNRIGWIFLATGFFASVNLLTWQYVDVDLHTAHRLPGAAAVAVVNA
jgi:hypothetical protein